MKNTKKKKPKDLTVAIEDGDDEEHKKKAAGTSQWAQYNERTKEDGYSCNTCVFITCYSPQRHKAHAEINVYSRE